MSNTTNNSAIQLFLLENKTSIFFKLLKNPSFFKYFYLKSGKGSWLRNSLFFFGLLFSIAFILGMYFLTEFLFFTFPDIYAYLSSEGRITQANDKGLALFLQAFTVMFSSTAMFPFFQQPFDYLTSLLKAQPDFSNVNFMGLDRFLILLKNIDMLKETEVGIIKAKMANNPNFSYQDFYLTLENIVQERYTKKESIETSIKNIQEQVAISY